MAYRTGLALVLLGATVLQGCASSPPGSAPAPGGSQPTTTSKEGFGDIIHGGSDSVSSIPGSADALYRYRFRQLEPASDRFTYQDRDLSFYFRPAPEALYFQVENRQNRPVWIDWERSVFYDPLNRSGKLAHSTTRWGDRFKSQPSTQISGQQRYSDYLLPMEYLFDPAGSDEQPHRPLLPEGTDAPQYTDTVFGADLVFMVEDRPRTYVFRFRVASVIPR